MWQKYLQWVYIYFFFVRSKKKNKNWAKGYFYYSDMYTCEFSLLFLLHILPIHNRWIQFYFNMNTKVLQFLYRCNNNNPVIIAEVNFIIFIPCIVDFLRSFCYWINIRFQKRKIWKNNYFVKVEPLITIFFTAKCLLHSTFVLNYPCKNFLTIFLWLLSCSFVSCKQSFWTSFFF